jgi:hypothetical protein
MQLGEETIALLARVADLDLGDSDLADLAQALEAHLEAFRVVDAMMLADVDAAARFDPHWDG